MGTQNPYKILIKNREKVRDKKIYEIIPDLLDKPVPATYGYFFLQEIFLNCQKLLNCLKDYEKTLGSALCNKLQKICEEEIFFMKDVVKKVAKEIGRNIDKEDSAGNFAIIPGFEIEEKTGLKTKDLCILFANSRLNCLEVCLAHVFLFTKNLLNIEGGRMFDPTSKDGLYKDLKNARKFYESIMELRNWETDRLWDAVWEPFGGQPSEEELEKIPEDKISFEIECIDWTWNWRPSGETVYGYLIDIQDLAVHPVETLEDLEKRIDRAITPIKKYLTKQRPSLSEWWE